MAEREGFEPSVRLPLHTLSKRAPSTTRTPLPCGQRVIVCCEQRIRKRMVTNNWEEGAGSQEPECAREATGLDFHGYAEVFLINVLIEQLCWLILRNLQFV